MKTIAFFLEELSAKVMLEGFIKAHFRHNPAEFDFRYCVHEGKQDLEKNLERRLKGWLLPDTIFVIIRDQDAGDCVRIKKILYNKCKKAGRPEAVVRIACHELESFYLGDPAAIERGLGLKNMTKSKGKAFFREPDMVVQPSKRLKTLTKGVYQKIDGSRRIAPFLNPQTNRSHSFGVLYKTLRDILCGNSGHIEGSAPSDFAGA
jgi:hypothetical protein